MENILGYRHFVNKEIKEIFLESIKKAITMIKPDKIGFIGVIGSFDDNLSHDIDVLMFPSVNARVGEAIRQMIKIYRKTDEIVKSKNKRYHVVTCPKKSSQELVYYLASIEEGAAGLIPVHSLFFTDFVSFEKFNPENFIEKIDKSLISVYGDFDVIKKLKSLPQGKLEPYFWILEFEMNARIKSFPKHLVRSSAESLFEYLNDKYNIKIKRTPHSIKKIEEQFLEILDKLDKKNYN